jgi:hypothetical protein
VIAGARPGATLVDVTGLQAFFDIVHSFVGW